MIQHQQRPKAEPKVQRTLQARIEELVDRFEGIAAAGEETGQLMTATAALKELHACLKTIGQLSGELTTATINFNLFNFATLREEQIIAFLDGIENGPPLAVARVRQLVIERLGPPHPIIQVQFRAPDYQPAAVELPRKVDDAIVR